MKKLTEEERRDKAYLDLVETSGFPRKFVPPDSVRERPVTSAALRDVPLYEDENHGVKLGEDIPAASQSDVYYKDCKRGFEGVAIYSGIRHTWPARHAAFAYAAERVKRGKLNPSMCAWRMVEYGFHDDWLDGPRAGVFQPDLLIVDAMYRECTVQRVEKIRSYVDLAAKTTIVIAAGISPVEAAYRRLNIDYGRVLFFL